MTIAYEMILGTPLVRWVGIATIITFITAAVLGWRMTKGKAKLKHHKWAAILGIVLALTHVTLVMELI